MVKRTVLIISLICFAYGCITNKVAKKSSDRYEIEKSIIVQEADVLNSLEIDSGKYTLLMYDFFSDVRYRNHAFHGKRIFLEVDSLEVFKASNRFDIPSPLIDVKAYFSDYQCFVCKVDSIYGSIRKVSYSNDSVVLALDLKYPGRVDERNPVSQQLINRTITFLPDNDFFKDFFEDYNGVYDNLRIALKEPLKVKKLELFGYHLTYGLDSLPESFGDMKNLEELDLSNLDLKKLPKSFAELTNLKKLDVGYNDFDEFPQQLYALKKLEHLDISLSGLDSIPPGMGQLQNLRTLILDDNTFKGFPIAVTDVSNLESLSITSANLSEIPEEIRDLQKLKKLDLSSFWSYKDKNHITDISNLTTLSNLESVDLDFNKIEKLPDNLCDLQNLRKISLLSNPIKEIPGNIRSCGIDTIAIDKPPVEKPQSKTRKSKNK